MEEELGFELVALYSLFVSVSKLSDLRQERSKSQETNEVWVQKSTVPWSIQFLVNLTLLEQFRGV